MKSVIPPSPPWSVESALGAIVVTALLAGLALTFWFGWPATSGWLFSR
jgi:hypothetical protein